MASRVETMETRKACLGRRRNGEREDSQGWVLKTQKQIRIGLQRRAWQTGLKRSPGEKPGGRRGGLQKPQEQGQGVWDRPAASG